MHLKLTQKISLLVVFAALASGLAVAFADFRSAAYELDRSAEAKLSALLDGRREALEEYLASLRRGLLSQAASPLVVEALASFRIGWDDLGPGAAAELRQLYITANSYPAGQRRLLDHPNDRSIYSLAHGRFHPRLRDFAAVNGFEDLLLLDPRGTVLYSVAKDERFAAAIAEAEVGLGRGFRRIIAAGDRAAEVFTDFASEPAGTRPVSFLVAPVYDARQTMIGMLALAVTIDQVNGMMRMAAGLGETGETYLIGEDRLMRTDSRFAAGSTILTRHVATEPVAAALATRAGVMVSREVLEDGAPVDRMVAYQPLEFLGTHWALIAAADLAEVRAPVNRMHDRAVLNAVLVTFLVAVTGLAAARWAVVRPLTAVTAAMRRIAQGDRRVAIPAVPRGDEIGDIARTLALLQEAQESLIQAEKMASLGQLVAGVAHEINTPVGITLTAASHLADQTVLLRRRFEEGAMRRSQLAEYLDIAVESTRIMMRNIERAAVLIRGFKAVAVDQASEERRHFNLKAYLEEILLTLRPRLKTLPHRITVECPADLELDGYPGALSQIVTNLVMNALTHAFGDGSTGSAEGRAGRMSIEATRAGPDLVELRFADDGKGIPRRHLSKIFDPFFTTGRGAGSNGLGLHIVFNIVSSTLHGKITVESEENRGTLFIIRFPRVVPADAAEDKPSEDRIEAIEGRSP